MSIKFTEEELYFRNEQIGELVPAPTLFSSADKFLSDKIDELDDEKMERYVIRLVKNTDNTYKMTSLDDEDLTFNEVYEVTKKLNEYVVVVYGNSKLRPQYVSTNEMMFIGIDRSTETKVLRILYTPTRLTYETFRLAEQRDLDEVQEELSTVKEDLSHQNDRITALEEGGDRITALEEGGSGGVSKEYVDEADSRLSESITEISDVVFQKSDNLFDVSKQTDETISPHYFVSGVPYSSTQFDKTWHCSAPVEVEPNTKYTLGCVPSFSGVTKPWNNAGEGIFFYDENMSYISKVNANTFVTPTNAKYIRFNFYIKFAGFSEKKALERCVLVYGEVLPTEYIPYEDTNIRKDLDNLRGEVDALKTTTGFAYKVDLQAKEMLVSYKYTNAQDCLIRMACGGGNGLFDFRAMYLFDNQDAPKIHDITGVTAWDNMNGDTFAPMQIVAINNIDGDNFQDGSTTIYKKYFTGGNHQYNNGGSGSTPTATCQNVKFYVNGFEIAENKTGVTNEIKVTWENLIQGYNTTKSDGTGRAILKERKSVVFDGKSFHCHTELVPLEPIKFVLWYGYQLMHNSKYDKCQYVDGTNRNVYARNAYTNCGDKEAKKLRIFHSINNDCIDVEITDFDLGKRNLFTGTNGIFNTDYGKAYFNIINGERDMVEGEVYTLDGKYTFRKGFV